MFIYLEIHPVRWLPGALTTSALLVDLLEAIGVIVMGRVLGGVTAEICWIGSEIDLGVVPAPLPDITVTLTGVGYTRPRRFLSICRGLGLFVHVVWVSVCGRHFFFLSSRPRFRGSPKIWFKGVDVYTFWF